MSYLPSHCDHSNWVKTQPQRQRFYAQLESFIWLLNLLRAGYCSCGRRRSTLSLVLDPRTTGVDSANSLFQTGHQRKGTLFQRYQQISVVTSIMVSIRAGRVKQQKSKVLALVNACWRCWQVCWIPACCCCCNLIQQRIEPGAQVFMATMAGGEWSSRNQRCLP